MKCPCEDCLCVPICRHKGYLRLVECSLVNKYLIAPCNPVTRSEKRVIKLNEILKSNIWNYKYIRLGGVSRLWIMCKESPEEE